MRLLAALLLLLAHPAHAADPPRYVAGPASGYQYDCEQAKQRAPRLSILVTEIPDLDGDGLPEHILDSAKGCEAVRALYCNEREGCTVQIYLSRWSGIAERHKATAWRVERSAGRATLHITTGGAECGGAPACTLPLRWTGERLLPVR
jgi:hypothetical protein